MTSLARIQTLSDGQLVAAREGAPAFSIILSGALQISFASESGHALVIAVVGQGSFVGLKALFGASAAGAKEYRSLGRTVLATMATKAIRRSMEQDPALHAHCVKLLVSRLTASLSALSDVVHAPLAQRLSRRLLGQALAAGHCEAGEAVDITVSQSLLAEMLGASRSTVGEELRRLDSAGIVQRRYRAVRILDMDRMRQLAGGGVHAI